MTPAEQAGRFGERQRRLLQTAALLLGLLTAGCGVPLAPQYLTATATSGGSLQQEPLSDGATLASSLPSSSGSLEQLAAGLRLTATPLATVPPPESTVTSASEPVLESALMALGLLDATPTRTATPTALASVTATPLPSETPQPGPTPTSTPTPTPSPSPTPTPDVSPSRVIELVNEIRADNGRSRLSSSSALNAAASAYAKLMAESDYFGHTGPDGSTPESRVLAAGYTGHFDGEAIAAGQQSAQAVVDVWMDSPPHRTILLSATAEEIGVGHHFEAGNLYGHYWVLVLGSR